MDSTLGDKAKEVFEFQTKMSDLNKTSSRSVRQKGQKKTVMVPLKMLISRHVLVDK